MKIKLLYSAVAAAALCCSGPVFGDDQKPQDQKTLGEKTADTLEKAKDKTLDAGQAVVDETKKAAETVKDAVLPDSNSRKVDVTLTERRIVMPRELPAGKTAFVVRNNGKERQNFKIEGPGLDKEFMIPVAPDESKTLNVELKPGDYKVLVPGKQAEFKGDEFTLSVK